MNEKILHFNRNYTLRQKKAILLNTHSGISTWNNYKYCDSKGSYNTQLSHVMFTHLNSKKGAVSTPQNLKGRKTITWEGVYLPKFRRQECETQ